MSLTSVSVVLAVFTSNINQRGFREVDLPRWFRTTVMALGRIMCFKMVHLVKELPSEFQMIPLSSRGYNLNMKTTFSNDSGCGLLDYENGDCRQNDQNHHSRRPSQKVTTTQTPLHEGNWELEEILRRLQVLIDRDEEKEKTDFYSKRWIEAAEVIDRFFFWIFIIGTTFSSVLLLLIMPMTKSVQIDGEVPVP